MARKSLSCSRALRRAVTVVVGSWLSSACIVAPPNEIEEPTRTPPILDLARAKPFVGDIIYFTRDQTNEEKIEFQVPVRSEDGGDDLIGALHLDYGSDESYRTFLAPFLSALASTLEDTKRTLDITLNSSAFKNEAPGCHQLTLFASHTSNWDRDLFRPKIAEAEHDTAMAVWWMILDPDSPPTSQMSCPVDAEIER